MTRIIMDYDLAMAVGRDAANRNMRKAGRERWNEDDWNVACETFDRLFPLEKQIQQQIPATGFTDEF